jgi:hypothetical protein
MSEEVIIQFLVIDLVLGFNMYSVIYCNVPNTLNRTFL